MADSEILKTVGVALGAGGGLAALGAFLNGLFNGAQGREKDLRDGLAQRVASLEEKVDHLEARLEQVARERDTMRFQRDRARIERDTARSRVNAYEGRLSEPATTWASDAPDGDGGKT